jgi:hypothetical protein
MTLISTDNDKTKKCFTMYLEKKGIEKPRTVFYTTNSEEHDIENLYIKMKIKPKIEPPIQHNRALLTQF